MVGGRLEQASKEAEIHVSIEDGIEGRHMEVGLRLDGHDARAVSGAFCTACKGAATEARLR
jgi:hypothetical protein